MALKESRFKVHFICWIIRVTFRKQMIIFTSEIYQLIRLGKPWYLICRGVYLFNEEVDWPERG